MVTISGKLSKEGKRRLLKLLTYEKVKGRPIYYRNYKKVLKGEMSPEAVMGSGDMQAYIIAILVAYLFSRLDRDRYIIMTNKLGFYTSEENFRLLDIAIFEKGKFKFTGGYTKNPPKVVIEVDTKADLKDYLSLEDYAFEKTQDLMNAGVEKVIWIFTNTKKVMIAEKGEKWIVQDWSEDFEVFEGIRLNIHEFIESKV